MTNQTELTFPATISEIEREAQRQPLRALCERLHVHTAPTWEIGFRRWRRLMEAGLVSPMEFLFVAAYACGWDEELFPGSGDEAFVAALHRCGVPEMAAWWQSDPFEFVAALFEAREQWIPVRVDCN